MAQNISFSKIYNMKTNVFRYYDSFFKEILDEEEYRNERLQINKFLVTFATDGYVFPFSPRTKSVGKEFGNGYLEHINISDITTTTYYLHRSYDRYLNTVAAKNNLELNDVKIFDLIRRSNHDILLRDIVEYTGISLPTLLISLEKLASRDYISFKMFPSAELSVNINSQTEIFIKDIDRAISDLYEVCTKGLSNDEISVLESLIKTLNSNMTEFLKNSIPANHKNRAS